ncbi:MAG: hypothetical protein JWO89_1654, partial [Verrucomicrobiaceae bacterium]|nr:hypothetical protein [Verrucomicrobiaceae bacterium]
MKSFFLLLLIAVLQASGSEPVDIAFKAGLDGSEQRYVELLPPAFDEGKVHDVVLAFHNP